MLTVMHHSEPWHGWPSNTRCAVAAASAVSVLAIDWIITGASPPTGT